MPCAGSTRLLRSSHTWSYNAEQQQRVRNETLPYRDPSEMNAWNELLNKTSSAQKGRRQRLARFARILDFYEEHFGRLPRIIKITGTSGKGSVCAILEAMLLRDGHRVCTFTSPHLVDPRERIRLDGEVITEDGWNLASEQMMPFFEQIL